MDLAAKLGKTKLNFLALPKCKRRHNMESIIYVGMDVHKETYSICCYKSSEDKNYYEKKMKASSANVIKYLKSVEKEFGEETMFLCGYEAGPTGFGLYRDLQKAGYACVVMAPTSLKKASGKRVKNDTVDARYLAKTLFTKDYSEVHVTTKHEEAIKEYCRMRLSIKKELKVAKQVLQAFLLRQDKKYTEGTTYWTINHKKWLAKLHFEESYLQEAFNEYMITINTLESRLKNIENRIEEIAKDSAVKDKVDKLVCFCGIETLTAVTIAAEIGDFNRFKKACHFSNYIGFGWAEDSSGQKERILGMNKCGNINIRRLLTESAKSIKKTNAGGKKSKRLLDRQKGKSPEIIAYADKCRNRLKSKMLHLESKGKHSNVSSTAAARELSCFIWGMMTNNIA